MLEQLRRLFDYDRWATSRIRAALGELAAAGAEAGGGLDSAAGGRALALYAHLYGSRRMWLGRVEASADAQQGTWPELSLDAADELRAEMEARWDALLDGLGEADLSREVRYTLPNGAAGWQSLGDILTHAVLHSMHHRAQIASLIREAGGTPPQNDFVVFTRETR
jgi:uncharacterized damage-inducible protein DinB